MSDGELAPCLGIIRGDWNLVPNQTGATTNSGETDILDLGTSIWAIDIDVNIKDRKHFDEWDRFLTSRNLQEHTFVMPRPLRRLPADGTITSDTGLTLQSYDYANSTLTFSGGGSAKKASFGDMVSYRTAGSGYWIGQVTSEATADGSGNITFGVSPRPVAPHASEPLPRRIEALGEFRLSEPHRKREKFKDYSISFKAEQVIR